MVSSIYASRLQRLGIETIRDLLYHIPSRYEDFSQITTINLLRAGEKVTVVGEITKFNNIYTKYGKKIQKAQFTDPTGEIELVWFNQPYLANVLRVGTKVALCGEAGWSAHTLVFQSPEYEFIKGMDSRLRGNDRINTQSHLIHSGRLVPIYPETEGISSKWLRSRIAHVLFTLSPDIPDMIPVDVRHSYHLLSSRDAIHTVHFPPTIDAAQSGRETLAFEELIVLQLMGAMRRREWKKQTVRNTFRIAPFQDNLEMFLKRLPFELTAAQKRTVSEIMKDLSEGSPMNRLLEGDVGSGKTVVATIAMYISYLNGYSSLLMAPTEILANQHYETVKRLLEPFEIPVGLITGNMKIKKGKSERSRSDAGQASMTKIYIGTHALLTENRIYPNVGLVVIDEQQRFGVAQRAQLRKKGNNPHVLSMTATPIPRTIALTLYSDLELSVLDELPKGRLKIKTWVVPLHKRENAYKWIRTQIQQTSSQAFIVCPLIEESETLSSVKSAKKEFASLQKDIFPDLRLALLHGRMKPIEKNKVLEQFQQGEFDILVSTPVVEVGIDIPNATIILIEAAERFGLAQLHQLRGRVGRGDKQSYCLLFTSETIDTLKGQTFKGIEKTIERLKYLETINIGPRLAEIDLKLRGAGELYGTKQHGATFLKIARWSDVSLIAESKRAAKILLTWDDTLSSFPLLREKVHEYTIKDVTPD